MKCVDPVLCYTVAKGKRIFRHWTILQYSKSLLLHRKPDRVFNCGQCIHCRKKRAYELACRCVLHASLYKENCFLTLTYDEKRKGYHNEFEYSDIQKFKKRLRSFCARKYNKKIEVFNVHEYGKNSKKHWHLIVFNFQFDDRILHTMSNGLPLYKSETLSRLWRYGFSTIGDVSEASAMYQAQYCEKDFKNGNITNEKKSHSKHSGLGRPYFEIHYDQILRLGYIPINGFKLPVPRYFERIAHKHWCHFNDESAFRDTSSRKALYRPFSPVSLANREISRLWELYSMQKQVKVVALENEWDEFQKDFLTHWETPDFIKSGENTLYDLHNKNTLKEKF